VSAHARTRTSWFALLTFALVGVGCGQQDESHTNTGPVTDGTAPTPATATETPAPADASRSTEAPPPASAPATSPAPTTPTPTPTSAEPAPEKPQASANPAAATTAAPADAAVTLEKVSYETFRKRIAANPAKAKYTMVDTWATWCGPCKENFPHVVEMSRKYAGKGLAVASLSFDDPTESKLVAEAEAFLREKQATFPNYLLDEETTAAFEKFEINTIPAVFLYGPDGKEVKRFTLDDPNKQFTYEEVEKTVAALLEGGDVPKSE
jgi:thiol-disulfide isomerase/thioredoxin